MDTTVFSNKVKQINVSYKYLKICYNSRLELINDSPYSIIYFDELIQAFNSQLFMIHTVLPDADLDEAQLNTKNVSLKTLSLDFDLCMKTMSESAATQKKTILERYSMFHSSESSNALTRPGEYPSEKYKFG